jgi:hypothetical protein
MSSDSYEDFRKIGKKSSQPPTQSKHEKWKREIMTDPLVPMTQDLVVLMKTEVMSQGRTGTRVQTMVVVGVTTFMVVVVGYDKSAIPEIMAIILILNTTSTISTGTEVLVKELMLTLLCRPRIL